MVKTVELAWTHGAMNSRGTVFGVLENCSSKPSIVTGLETSGAASAEGAGLALPGMKRALKSTTTY